MKFSSTSGCIVLAVILSQYLRLAVSFVLVLHIKFKDMKVLGGGGSLSFEHSV